MFSVEIKQKNNSFSDFIFLLFLFTNLIVYKFSVGVKDHKILDVFFYITVLVLFFFIKLNSKKTSGKIEHPKIRKWLLIFLFLSFLFSFDYFGLRILLTKIAGINISPDEGFEVFKNIKFGMIAQYISLSCFDVAIEEFVFRKCLYEFMLSRMVPCASVLTSLIFSFLHPHGSIFDYVFKILFSLELNFIYKKTSSLLSTILVHMFVDFFTGFFILEKNAFSSADPIFVFLIILIFLGSIIFLNRKIGFLKNELIYENRSKIYRYSIMLLLVTCVSFMILIKRV